MIRAAAAAIGALLAGAAQAGPLNFISLTDFQAACGGLTDATCLFNAAIDAANTANNPRGQMIYVPDGQAWRIEAPLHTITAPGVEFFSLGQGEIVADARGCSFTWEPPAPSVGGGGLSRLTVSATAPIADDVLACIVTGNRQRLSDLTLHGIGGLARLGTLSSQFAHVHIERIEGWTADLGVPVIHAMNGAELGLDRIWLYNQIQARGQGKPGSDFLALDSGSIDTVIARGVNVWGYDHCVMVNAGVGSQFIDLWLDGLIADYCGFAGAEFWAHDGGSIGGLHLTGQSWATAYGNTAGPPLAAVFMLAETGGGIFNATLDLTMPQALGGGLLAVARTGGSIDRLTLPAPGNFQGWEGDAIAVQALQGGSVTDMQLGPGLSFRGIGAAIRLTTDGSMLSGRIGVNRYDGTAVIPDGSVVMENSP